MKKINDYRKKRHYLAFIFLVLCSLFYDGMAHVHANEIVNSLSLEVSTVVISDDKIDIDEIPILPVTVELIGKSPNAPMPVENRLTINGEGKNYFNFSFESEGIYQYSISQTTKEMSDWILDKKVYDVTIYVKEDKQGNLVASVVGVNHDSNEKISYFTFENHYTKKMEKPEPVPHSTSKSDKSSKPKHGQLPETGESRSYLVYAGLAIVLGVILFVRIKKHDSKETQDKE